MNLVYQTLNYFEKSVILTFVQNYDVLILNIKEIIKDKALYFTAIQDVYSAFLTFWKKLKIVPIVC